MRHHSAGIDALVNEFSPVLSALGKTCGSAQIGSVALANIDLACREGDMAPRLFRCNLFFVLGNVTRSLSTEETTFTRILISVAVAPASAVAVTPSTVAVTVSPAITSAITSAVARTVTIASLGLADLFLPFPLGFLCLVAVFALAAALATDLGLLEVFAEATSRRRILVLTPH